MKQNHPELKTFEIAREIGKNWRDMPASERRVYQQEYEHEKREYYERINMYNRSGPYQQYLGIINACLRAYEYSLKFSAAKQRWESAEIKDDDDMYFSMEPVDDVQTDDNAFRYVSLSLTGNNFIFQSSCFVRSSIPSKQIFHDGHFVRICDYKPNENYAPRATRLFICS